MIHTFNSFNWNDYLWFIFLSTYGFNMNQYSNKTEVTIKYSCPEYHREKSWGQIRKHNQQRGSECLSRLFWVRWGTRLEMRSSTMKKNWKKIDMETKTWVIHLEVSSSSQRVWIVPWTLLLKRQTSSWHPGYRCCHDDCQGGKMMTQMLHTWQEAEIDCIALEGSRQTKKQSYPSCRRW